MSVCFPQWWCNGIQGLCRPWWRHQMQTISASLALCSGNSPLIGEFPSQRASGALMFPSICTLNKRLSKQSRDWWYETPLCSLWRHCNALVAQWIVLSTTTGATIDDKVGITTASGIQWLSLWVCFSIRRVYFNGLLQKRRNSSASAMKLRLFFQ